MHNGLINEIIPVRGHREMRFWRAMRATLVLAGLTYATTAHAVPLVQGNSLTITSGGVSVLVTVAGCTINGATNQCTATTASITQNGSYLGVIVQPSTGNFVNYPNDITYSLNFSSNIPINGLTLAMIGAGDLTSDGGNLSVNSVHIPVSASPGAPDTVAFSPVTTFSQTLDAQPYDSGGGAAYITSATENLTATPEPAGIGLLMLGIAATVVLRRRRR